MSFNRFFLIVNHCELRRCIILATELLAKEFLASSSTSDFRRSPRLCPARATAFSISRDARSFFSGKILVARSARPRSPERRRSPGRQVNVPSHRPTVDGLELCACFRALRDTLSPGLSHRALPSAMLVRARAGSSATFGKKPSISRTAASRSAAVVAAARMARKCAMRKRRWLRLWYLTSQRVLRHRQPFLSASTPSRFVAVSIRNASACSSRARLSKASFSKSPRPFFRPPRHAFGYPSPSPRES